MATKTDAPPDPAAAIRRRAAERAQREAEVQAAAQSPPQSAGQPAAAASKPAAAAAPQPGGLPAPWTEVLDEGSGECYFYNTETGESTWDRPGAGQPGAPPPPPLLGQQVVIHGLLARPELNGRHGVAGTAGAIRTTPLEPRTLPSSINWIGSVRRASRRDVQRCHGSLHRAVREPGAECVAQGGQPQG